MTLPVHILRRGSAEAVDMIDASFRGLFVRMDDPPPVRELVKLRLSLPHRDLDVHAVVVRIVEDELGRAGVGLRFFALNGEDLLEWESAASEILGFASPPGADAETARAA